MLAALVITPRTAAWCSIVAPASLMMPSAASLSADCLAPRLASLSASWLARHSATVTVLPLDLALPSIASMEPCDGIHTRLLLREVRLPPERSMISFQILAVAFLGEAAASAPACAVLSTPM